MAEKLRDEYFLKLGSRAVSLLLCGSSDRSGSSRRSRLRQELSKRRRNVRFDIYYPEDLFGELITIPDNDLLRLEQLLGQSVEIIVILLESAGSIAELGAFSSSYPLMNRMIVIVEKKHKGEKSFIIQGPVRFLSRKTKSRVIYERFTPFDATNVADRIHQNVRLMLRKPLPTRSVSNPIDAYRYVLGVVNTLQPVLRDTLNEVVMHASGLNKQEASTITSTALQLAKSRGQVAQSYSGLRLTKDGATGLQGFLDASPDKTAISELLDTLRVQVLNNRLRSPIVLAS
ncbi:MAG: hypothetical protein IIB11_03990 [Chloroflexi bacterium]|nr:hypothetical protein [Chloroflexota bacterium]